MGKWFFPVWEETDNVRRGIHDENLFKEGQTKEDESAVSSALVREILQNSLDARSIENDDQPVRVRIAIHEPQDAPSAERLKEYFERLREPAQDKEIDVKFDRQGKPDIPCRFLVVEDFGTRGLEGDEKLFRDPSPKDTSPQFFFWFWRNMGRSGKTGKDLEKLGRWGLGKTVYRAVSRLRCMMGLTVRESDHRKLLMGQAVLPLHTYDGKEYQPEGSWGRSEAKSVLPIESPLELQRFAKDWKLSRKNEPGLSVVSPYVPDDLKMVPLLQAVCVGFFVPILRGELEVELVGKGLEKFGGTVLLDRKNIESVCEQVKWDGGISSKRHLAPPIVFASACLAQKPSIETNLVGKTKIPKWTQDDDDPVFSESVLDQLRRDFADQKRIGVRVQIELLRQDGDSQTGCFDIWLQKDNQCATSESYYVRDGMTITKIRSSKAKSGLFALVLIDGGPLSNLLGDTEDPSHRDWNSSSNRSELKQWKQWKGRVKFVTDAVNGLIELLTPPITEPNFELLSDFFSIDMPPSAVRRSPKEKSVVSESDGESHNPDIPSVLVEPKWYYFYKDQKNGLAGFRVARRKSVAMPSGFYLRVTVAYDTSKGDAFKQWSPLDFVISDGGTLRASGKKASAFRQHGNPGNVINLHILDDDFEFALHGFDPIRDLVVRVDAIPEEYTQTLRRKPHAKTS